MLTKVKDMDKDTITEYSYDGAGNRIQKTITKNNVIHSQTDYVVDTESFYQDTVTSKNALTGEVSDYTYGNGLISVDTNNVISYYRIDDQNSVEEIQSATGNVNSELEYDEFGILKNPETIKTSGILFAYTGYSYEETTGIYYAKARYYDSEQGRFISEDSYRGDISNPISLNLYTYCSNSSILNTDPSGNKIRFTQTDNFLLGFIKGAIAEFDFNVFGSLEESLVNLDAMGDLIQDIVSGKITDKELLAIGINEAVGDLHYVIKNFHIVSSKKTYSNATVYKFGKHLAGAYGEMVRAVATVVGAVKSVKALKAKIKGAIKAKNTKPSNAKGASKTTDIFNSGKKALDNFDIDSAYVKPKHLSTTGGNGQKFLGGSKAAAESILKDAMKNGTVKSIIDNGLTKAGNASYEIIIDAGKTVGTRGETMVKVVISEDGGMLSAYPIK